MIYIVEDDDAIRELEQYALQSNGYEVASFASSEPFWQAMRTEAPELVILDVMLPGEDGFSILKKLRNTPFLHRLLIIMVTAKSSELDTVRGLDCGATTTFPSRSASWSSSAGCGLLCAGRLRRHGPMCSASMRSCWTMHVTA